MDDREGAVAEAVHLGQPARLVEGGHQEEVGTGHDAVGQFFIEPDFDPDLFGIPGGQALEIFLELEIARAEQDEADAVRQQVFDRLRIRSTPFW